MMISDAIENNTDNISVVIDIINQVPTEEAEPESEECGRVCVCRVPKSLSSGKPEAFIPHFVGLGPYHHTRSEITMTDELKLAAAKRVFKHTFEIRISDIQPFYHADAFNSSYYKDQLLHDMTLDALFLLALLHRSEHAKPQQHSYFLTGKHGLPLVNAFGVELTMDAIIRDVFMLENQIPTHVLEQISQVSSQDEIQQQDLGAKMQSFCEKHYPLVSSEKLSKTPEAHDHLLDLMYHLIVRAKPEGEDEKGEKDSGNSQHAIRQSDGGVSIYYLLGFISPLFESDPESQDEEGKKNSGNTCCSRCYTTCYSMCFGFFFICRIIIGFFLLFICLVIFWGWGLIRLIPTLFKRALFSLYDLLIYMSRLIHPIVDSLYGSLSNRQNQNQLLKSFTLLVGGVKRASEELLRDSANSDKDVRSLVTIPSVTELHKAGIGFQPAKGGISTIEFDEGTCQLSLPAIKLDVNSEVITRNLAAYESLIDSDRPLVFSRYIELMRAIINTAEDVKLLVHRDIIKTDLGHEVVADFFNGMSKSIRPTNTPDLEKEIKKVNAKFDDSQKVKRAMVRYVYSAEKFYTVVAALVFLALTAVQAYCSVYNCSGTSKYRKIPLDGDYNRNNYFISSL